MKKTLLFVSVMALGTSFAQNCSDLFISEYVEGWSNNKALEIYNPTANSINLNQYFVARYSNGATSATNSNAIQLTGTIAPYSTYVAVLDKRNPLGTGQEAPIWDSLEVRGDGFYCPVYNTSNAFYFNGNDAVVLAKGVLSGSPTANVTTSAGFQIVDIFGKIGEDPLNSSGTTDPDGAWTNQFPHSTGLGVAITQDHSIIRKATIQKGITIQVSFFNPLGEWDSIPAVIVRLDLNGDTIFGSSGNPILDGNWNSLGTHECDCAPLSVNSMKPLAEVALFPNPTNGIVYIKGAAIITKVQVLNSLGQTVAMIENHSKSILSIDLGAYKGLYLLKITDESGSQTTKRVIVK
jgi:hypothetical protein